MFEKLHGYDVLTKTHDFKICIHDVFIGGLYYDIACEGMDLNLLCNDGDAIRVAHANYGRTSVSICIGENQVI